jgi:cation diffusion facilitator CzcD-associated flavoprotein CzcO
VPDHQREEELPMSADQGNRRTSTGVDYDAIIVGAGFGGLRMLHELRTMGVSVKVIEGGADVGGTWYWNRYPGARTDSEAWVYCYSFSEELLDEWSWSERYPSQPEVLRYLNHVADKLELREDIQFNAWVTSAQFEQESGHWVVSTSDGGRQRCTFFIPATGPLSRPIDPPFEGLHSYKGQWYLSARWPADEVDFTGKRVGIIGTGATGIQLVPVLASDVEQVVVFQRTPNYVVPARNRPLTVDERQCIKSSYDAIWALTQQHVSGFAIEESDVRLRDVPVEDREAVFQRAWESGGFTFLFGTFRDLLVDEEANEAASEFVRARIREIVQDPATAELLSPKGYPFGAKRPPLGHSYYEAFNRDNVHLIDVSEMPIRRITPSGVQVGETEYPVDVLIFATGFDGSTGALLAMDIRGRSGITLREYWADGPRTYLGVGVDEFPNMFLISGPQSPFGNIPVVIENSVKWIGDVISFVSSEGCACIEPTRDAVDGWVAEAALMMSRSLVRRGAAAHSWMVGANIEGKAHSALFYFGRANVYFDRLRAEARDGFPGFIRGKVGG